MTDINKIRAAIDDGGGQSVDAEGVIQKLTESGFVIISIDDIRSDRCGEIVFANQQDVAAAYAAKRKAGGW